MAHAAVARALIAFAHLTPLSALEQIVKVLIETERQLFDRNNVLACIVDFLVTHSETPSLQASVYEKVLEAILNKYL
jgi:hypothetical protein